MSGDNLYLAIDQGGGSTRAIVFNGSSQLIASASKPVDVEHPRLGWVEQDPEAIVASINSVLTAIAKELKQSIKNIVRAGLATQRSNVVCWRKSDGAALSSAISWQDRREYHWMNGFKSHQELIRNKTGLVVSPHYGVSKIKWCLENIELVKEARSENNLVCGPLASFLTYRITNRRHAMADPANASRTLLWNLQSGNWDEELLDLFGLESDYLPECTCSYSDYGELELSGHVVPLRVVTGDQSAALYANGIPEQDSVYINMGTGVFIQHPTGNKIIDIPGLLCSTVYQDKNTKSYVTESTINGASNALMEIEEALGISGEEAENNLASWFEQYTDPPLFLNGVAGLAAPYWVPDFASRFVGKGAPEEKILAVAESILFLVKVNVQVLQENDLQMTKIKMTGGLSRADCLCQKLANLLQLPVIRSEQAEATAMGLAYLVAQCPSTWQVSDNGQVFYPEEDALLMQRFEAWQKEMSRALEKYNRT